MGASLTVWLLLPLLQACLAVLLVIRGVHRQFRCFFIYTVFAVCAEAVKLSLSSRPAAYYYSYWAADSIYAVLGFLAIAEVFFYVFKNFQGLWWFRFVLPVTAAVMLAVAVLIPLTRHSVNMPLSLAAIYWVEIAVRCLQLGIFFLIFLLARMFNMYYRQYAFGIAAGFGISAIGTLLAVIVRSAFGTVHKSFLTLGPALAYDGAVLVWLLSFAIQEAPDPFNDFRHLFTPELFLEQLQQYREQIKGILRP